MGIMAHEPCGVGIPGGHKKRCMKDRQCGAKMPRPQEPVTDATVDGYAHYRRREFLDTKETIKMPSKSKFVASGKSRYRAEFGNCWLPGYNPSLLMKYRLHINVEYCGSIKAISYLYK